MPQVERITRSSFEVPLSPISAPRRLRNLPARIWTEQEWERIQRGRVSRGMDDKWDIFAEDDTLFLHRSWNGRGIYELSFRQVEGGRKITEGLVESKRKFYRSPSAYYDATQAEALISNLLLGERATELLERLRAAL